MNNETQEAISTLGLNYLLAICDHVHAEEDLDKQAAIRAHVIFSLLWMAAIQATFVCVKPSQLNGDPAVALYRTLLRELLGTVNRCLWEAGARIAIEVPEEYLAGPW